MPLREYSCEVKLRTPRAYLSVLGLVLLACVIWMILSKFAPAYSLVWHFAAMLSLTGAMLLTVRYLVRRYIYRLVETDEGDFDFVVLEISGKRTVCVCRLSVSCLCALSRVDKRAGRVRPDYDWTVMPGHDAYLLTLRDGGGNFFEAGEEIVVRISPDSTMAAMLAYSLRTPL